MSGFGQKEPLTGAWRNGLYHPSARCRTDSHAEIECTKELLIKTVVPCGL